MGGFAMIARSTRWPFGGRITAIHTPAFKCVLSTNKEGVFKPLSTMIIEGDTVDGVANTRPCAKLIYSPALRKEDIQNLHTVICQAIDKGGEAGISLGMVLEEVFTSLRQKGLLSEAINLAT
jgi:hypothetical protein